MCRAPEPLSPTRAVPRISLFHKYALVLLALVSLALITSDAVQSFFAYRENEAALVALQHENALGAATQIAAFIGGIRQLEAVALSRPIQSDAVAPDQVELEAQ